MVIRDKQEALRLVYAAALLAGFAALVLARLPNVIGQGGRFWAEEGVIYFSNAWRLPWWKAWFAIHTGYINLAAGLGTWLGLELGGITHAPLVTALLALMIQALPPFISLTHEFPWRRSWLGCLAAVALCALPPVTGEVWLNTITSQFHFALAAALILAAPARQGALLAFDMAVIALGVLSGPATSFLLPLFLLRGVVTRRRADVLLCIVIFLGFCVQAGVYLTHMEPARNGHLSFTELMAAIALHIVVLSVAGYHAAGQFAGYVMALHTRHAFLWPGLLIVVLFYAVLIWAVTRSGRYRPQLALLLGAHAVFALVSFDNALFGDFAGVMGTIGDQRYAFASMVLTGLLFTACACAASGAPRVLCVLLTIWLLATGILNFRAGTVLFANGPSWAQQMPEWHANPQMVLSVWPDQWYMQLPPRH